MSRFLETFADVDLPEFMPTIPVLLFVGIDAASPFIADGTLNWSPLKAETTWIAGEEQVYVTLDPDVIDQGGRDLEPVLALLSHEAYHCAQRYMDAIGEERPGEEEMAYCVQAFADQLFRQFFHWLEIGRTLEVEG